MDMPHTSSPGIISAMVKSSPAPKYSSDYASAEKDDVIAVNGSAETTKAKTRSNRATLMNFFTMMTS